MSEIAGVNPLEILHAATTAMTEDDVSQVVIDLSERRESGWQIRATITIRRETGNGE